MQALIEGSEGAIAEVQAGSKFRDSLGRFMVGNKMAPSKRFTSREHLASAVLAYFQDCESGNEYPTMTGLALSLGFTSRQALMNYNKEPGYEEYFEVVSWARMQIEASFEQRVINPKTLNVSGLIFALKQMGWTDKQEIRMDQRSVNLTGFKMIRNDDHGSTDQAN